MAPCLRRIGLRYNRKLPILFDISFQGAAAAARSPALYENLALFDALRMGNARERALAQDLFETRL
mgnify:CR=1 FL=1